MDPKSFFGVGLNLRLELAFGLKDLLGSLGHAAEAMRARRLARARVVVALPLSLAFPELALLVIILAVVIRLLVQVV